MVYWHSLEIILSFNSSISLVLARTQALSGLFLSEIAFPVVSHDSTLPLRLKFPRQLPKN